MQFTKFLSNVFSYKNKSHMTFDETNVEPDQVFELVQDLNGMVEYVTKLVEP